MWTQRPFEYALACALIVAAMLAAGRASGAPPVATDATAPAPVPDSEDPLATYRDRFKLGMDQYHAGSLANAIGYWEPVYGELGAQKGYRLAYDLGVAYAEIGDATRAAERLQSFLDDVERRKNNGETLDTIVTKEEADARLRIDGFVATKARLRVDAGAVPVTVQIDANDPRLAGFVAWVAPGEHTVTFGPGTASAETQTVRAGAGEVVDLVPPSVPVAAPGVPAPAAIAAGPLPPLAPLSPPPPSVPPYPPHPFPPMLLAVTGGLAAAATVVAIPLESHASDLRTRYAAEERSDGVIPQANRESFDDARTWAYTAVGTAVGLGVVTGALTTWYLLGTPHHEVPVEPSVTRERGGASVGLRVRF